MRSFDHDLPLLEQRARRVVVTDVGLQPVPEARLGARGSVRDRNARLVPLASRELGVLTGLVPVGLTEPVGTLPRAFCAIRRDEAIVDVDDAVRDDEVAAESAGVPTLKLKLVSTTVMGAMMGVAGAPFPYFVTFVDPVSAFNLFIAVNAIAMPMIGGTTRPSSWIVAPPKRP